MRTYGSMSLQTGLTTLAGGPAFELKQNPVTCTVNFHLKASYKKYVTDQKYKGEKA